MGCISVIPIMSVGLTPFWMLLFMGSMILLRAIITVLRFCGIVIRCFEVERELMQAIGRVMLSVVTPLFWILSSLRYIGWAVFH